MSKTEPQPRNIVILCDGTGNEIEESLSNVTKLYKCLIRDERQIVFYDPGIGTIGKKSQWARRSQDLVSVLSLATGYGLRDKVCRAYRFLMENYRDGDQIFLFGFSRGAYTARTLAGMIRAVGLMEREQVNLVDYAYKAYLSCIPKGGAPDWTAARQFQRTTRAQYVPIHFAGLWDTVSSVIVPKGGWFRVENMPFTLSNELVRTWRHAVAIDERRAMFNYDHIDPRKYKPLPWLPDEGAEDQDIKEVWFAGVHSDIGGGLPEEESQLAKYPLLWITREAIASGLRAEERLVQRYVLGDNTGQGASGKTKMQYVAPSLEPAPYNNLKGFWKVVEYLPLPLRTRHRSGKRFLFWPAHRSAPRKMEKNPMVHHSAITKRQTDPAYDPPNLPKDERCTVVQDALR